MTRTVAAVILALTLSLTFSVSLDAQPPQSDMSGTWQIMATHPGAEGAFLHIWTYGGVIASKDYVKTRFQITRVGETDDAGLYHIQQHDGYYLTVKEDGKVVGSKDKPSENSARWVVWKNSNGYSITSWDDGGKGANALGFFTKDYGKTIEGPNSSGRYTLELARNNAGGRGNSHQLWELTKK